MSTQPAPTPETDGKCLIWNTEVTLSIRNDGSINGRVVEADFARELERQRNEATAQLAELQTSLEAKDAQILALREALDVLREDCGYITDTNSAYCLQCRKEAKTPAEVIHEEGCVQPYIDKALSTPPPAVVPLAKLQDAEADAESLKEMLRLVSTSYHLPAHGLRCFAKEALAAHEARVK